MGNELDLAVHMQLVGGAGDITGAGSQTSSCKLRSKLVSAVMGCSSAASDRCSMQVKPPRAMLAFSALSEIDVSWLSCLFLASTDPQTSSISPRHASWRF